MTLRYQVNAPDGAIKVPPLTRPERRDELWRHTCAELFVATAAERGYCEFNFSPSTEWAAYTFDDYRQGMRPMECMAPTIDVRRDTDTLRMTVECHLPASLATVASLRFGMTMVIEDTDHELSFWALTHPGNRPDFHDRAGFTLSL